MNGHRLYLVKIATGELGLFRGRDVLMVSDTESLALHGKVLDLARKLSRSLGEPIETVTKPELPVGPNPWQTIADSISPAGDRQIYYEGLIYDWRLGANGDNDIDYMPDHHRTPYKIEISNNGPHSSQFLLRMAPEHDSPDDIDGRPQIDIFVEINEGVPCLHMSPYFYDGEAAISVFAAEGQKLVVRNNLTRSLDIVTEFNNDYPAAGRVMKP